MRAWLIAVAGVALVLVSRWLILTALRQPAIGALVWIAPRGLITVLLFLSARDTGRIDGFPFGAVMLIVLATAALTALAHRRGGHVAKAAATTSAEGAPVADVSPPAGTPEGGGTG